MMNDNYSQISCLWGFGKQTYSALGLYTPHFDEGDKIQVFKAESFFGLAFDREIFDHKLSFLVVQLDVA